MSDSPAKFIKDWKDHYFPIIYVRGYAATMAEIEETVGTPYMGFELGSTKVRLDAQKRPQRFIFESPLVRLMKDFAYSDCYHAGEINFVERGDLPDGEKEPPRKARSIWIFRYYDRASEDLGDAKRPTIVEHAIALREYVLEIRDFLCGKDENARDLFRVNLVAHSMGGLICRAYLQNICRNGLPPLDKMSAAERKDTSDRAQRLELADPAARNHLVHKLFTYGTPHNGIDLLGMNVPNLRALDTLHVGNFNRERIGEYLALSDAAKTADEYHSLDGAFDPGRVFCFIGTNYRDYAAFFGLSRRATGQGSDGLVMCENAYVKGAARAFAHRAHSGPYGIVNSEEGYQNLRRFLFGTTRVDALIEFEKITLPAEIQKHRDAGKDVSAAYQIESAAQVRGANVKLHERREAHESASTRTYDELMGKNGVERDPVYLFSGFLDFNLGRKLDARGNEVKEGENYDVIESVFAVQVAVKRPVYQIGRHFLWKDHIEGADLYNEVILFRVRVGPRQKGISVKYGFAREDGSSEAQRVAEVENHPDRSGAFRIQVSLGDPIDKIGHGRISARLVLRVEEIQAPA